MRILVTGSSLYFAAALIRGLVRHGAQVTAADSRWFSPGKSVRRVARRLLTPAVSRDPAGFISALRDEVAARSYDLLLPAFEESLLISEYRDELEEHTNVLLPSFDDMWRVHHKPSLYRLCLELGIPAPATFVPASADELESLIPQLPFPVLLKLPASNNCIGRTFCEGPSELVDQYTALARRERRAGDAPPFVQQKIEGEPIYTLMFCHGGSKLGEVIYRPLRTLPENKGTSAHRESIAHPAIATFSEKLAASTQWSGFLGMDFLVDERDGTPYLIDCNPRTNPAIQLGFLAGIDWAGLVTSAVAGRDGVPAYARAGIRNRSLLLDLGWLVEGFRPQPHWPRRVIERLHKFFRPDWELHARHDFLTQGEVRCALAIAGQTIGGGLRSLLTGREIGFTILDQEVYSPVAARHMRLERAALLGQPVAPARPRAA